MSRIVGARADLCLLADTSTRVHIPSLMAMPRRRARAGTLVQFEGDEFPTEFRGTARSGGFDLSCRYPTRDRALHVALVRLIDELAPAAFDSRLLLRTHVEDAHLLPQPLQQYVAGGAAVAVSVFELLETPLQAGAVDVTFTATIVQHTFKV